MALNFTPRGQASSPNQPTNPTPTAQTRAQVSYGTPKASTARVDALKAKLSGKPAPVATPQATRRAGSSARAEEFASLKKFPAPGQAPTQQPARQNLSPDGTDLSKVAPPPSGRIPGTETPADLSQIHNSIETSPPAAATSEPLSPQFVALAKEAKAIRRAQQALKAEKEALQQERTGLIKLSDLTSDPLKYLAEAGIDYNRLTELQLGQIAPDPNQALLTKIAELEAKLTGVDEKFVSRDKQQYDAAVNQIRKDAKLLVDSDEAFETIRSEGASEDVVELITRIFGEEGEILPVEEAAKLIEEKLVDRKWQDYERLSKLSKIKSRLTPQAELAEASPVQQHPQNQTTTLTRNGASQRPLTARERGILAIERAKTRE